MQVNSNGCSTAGTAPVMGVYEVRLKCVGGPVDAHVVPNAEEVQRRRYIGGMIMPEDLESLDLLLRVPLDGAVSEAVFSRRERDKLRRLGPRLIHCDVDGATRAVRRLAAPPASVRDVFVRRKNWNTALRQATRFAPYCRRSIILPSLPVDAETLLLEACFFGVGVGIDAGGGATPLWLLEPAPFVPERFTGASWKFSEAALEAWQSTPVHNRIERAF